MKRLLLSLIAFLCFSQILWAQQSHLSLIYDFEGENFDYYVTGMVGQNDSLYIISNTPDGRGQFFSIDGNGEGYHLIWEFDNINFAPSSLIANDTIIYGTTRFSANGGGTIFKYSLTDYSFEFVKDFSPDDVQEVQIKYVTDSVLWLTSQWSYEDDGSIFVINSDGTNFRKIYNDTNSEKGNSPVDMVFHEGKIYIACYGGGGTPYPDGNGSMVESGAFIRINTDGTGYEMIVPGGDGIGTQPQSIIIRENKLFGLFAYNGSKSWGAQFFRSNLDGSSYDSLGGLDNRALTRMMSTDSLIYGISSHNIFGINPFNGEIRIFDDILSNPDFGFDVVSNPAYLNGHVYITAQQGGPDGGGTILKWSNEAPKVNEANANGRIAGATTTLNLNELFSDPEADKLTFSWKHDEKQVSVRESKGVLTLTPLTTGDIDIKITATDGWAGYKSKTYRLNAEQITTGIDEQQTTAFIYPNPTHSVIRINGSNVESIEIYGLDGKVYASYQNPGNEVNISSLRNGLYMVKGRINGKSYSQKIVKE